MRALLALWAALALACAGTPEVAPLDTSTCQTPPTSLGPLDVAIAIDTSRSVARMSGADADGNGIVGRMERSQYTDPGDSLLALQVAATRSLLRATAGSEVRFAIVTFAGDGRSPNFRPPQRVVRPGEAALQAGLTRDVNQLDAALHRVLARGPYGNTNFAAGMRTAVRSLLGPEGAPKAPQVRRLVLFLSDATHPVIIDEERKVSIIDPIMQDVARIAIRERIAFDTFGLGQASSALAPHTLTQIAGATGGHFTPVRQPEALHCQMLSSLVSNSPVK